jgi:dTDP-4-dehydrorhamnose reductase
VVATAEEMKWGITGGGGQLARSLSELLQKKRIPYKSWDRQEMDITDLKSLEKIAQYKPSVLVNCAAWTNVEGAEDSFDEAIRVNRDGAANVAEIAKKLNIPIIHISTDYVFSGVNKRAWMVDDSTFPTSNYGRSKLQGERALFEIWPEKSIIFRTAWLYGPFGKNFAKSIIRKAIISKEKISVVNDQFGQPTTTLDLAKQIFQAMKNGISAGTYHATNAGEASWWEFARELVKLSDEDTDRVIPISSHELNSKVKRPAYSVLDHSDWSKVGMQGMRDWQSALLEVFPEIKISVEKEK